MSKNTNFAALVSIAAVLYGADAMAQVHVEEDETLTESRKARREHERSQDVSPTTGKTAAEIINEARERVEGKAWARPDWRQTEHEEKQRRKEMAERNPRTWYVSFGGEPDTHAQLGEVYRVMAAQRDSTPLQYLEPLHETSPESGGGAMTLAVGIELTSWLDIELARHDIENKWQFGNGGPVFDPTLSGTAQDTSASQYGSFEVSSYSLSLLPRWDINRHVALFGRIGVAYAETEIYAHLTSTGWVSATETCNVDANGQRVCSTSRKYEDRDWGQIHERRGGFVPVAGIGVQLWQFLRLEFMVRDDVPIGDATTDVSSNVYLSFRAKGTWIANGGCSADCMY